MDDAKDGRSPLFNGEPVIVVHLGTSGAPQRAACSGEPFSLMRAAQHPHVPRVLCPACHRALPTVPSTERGRISGERWVEPPARGSDAGCDGATMSDATTDRPPAPRVNWPLVCALAADDATSDADVGHAFRLWMWGAPAGGAATKCPHCGMPMARRLTGEFCMNDDCPGFPKGGER